MNKFSTIFLTAPIHNRAWILPDWLKHILNQNYPKQNIEMYFLVNNCTDNSLEILQEFKFKYENEYKKITIDIMNNKNSIKKQYKDERTTETRDKMYHWLSELRNKTLDKFVESDCDLYFSLDSDILIKEDCITRFLEHEFDYLSNLIYNGYKHENMDYLIQESDGKDLESKINNARKKYMNILQNFNFETAYKFPNVLKRVGIDNYQHICNNRIKNPHKCDRNYKMEVDYTGAIFMVNRKIAENKNCRFNYHKTGEDEYFCRMVRKEGFKIECLVSSFQCHIMDKGLLPLYYQGKLNIENN